MAHLKKSMYHIDTSNFCDITREVSPTMLVYPGDPHPRYKAFQTIEKNGVNVSEITLGSHTGTHVDSPWHFLPGGNTIDKEPAEKFIGQAFVADLSLLGGRGISRSDLERYDLQDDILLMYTGTGERQTDFGYLEPDGAEWIVEHGVKSVGIDTLSVEKYGRHDAPVHKMLLRNGIGIMENLGPALAKCVGRTMFLFCSYLPLVGLDGSPARAILFEIIK